MLNEYHTTRVIRAVLYDAIKSKKYMNIDHNLYKVQNAVHINRRTSHTHLYMFIAVHCIFSIHSTRCYFGLQFSNIYFTFFQIKITFSMTVKVKFSSLFVYVLKWSPSVVILKWLVEILAPSAGHNLSVGAWSTATLW